MVPLFFLVLVVSCAEDRPAPVKNAGPVYVADSTKHRLMKIIQGGWVSADYIDTLYKYNSPVLANKGIPVLQLVFDTARFIGDTMYNGFHRDSYSASEQFDVVFKNENGSVKMIPRPYPSIEFKLDEVKYRITDHDTTLILVAAGKEYSFRKVFSVFPEYGKVRLNALDVFVDGWLSCYEWKKEDLSGKISFDKTGIVSGFGKYQRYSVKTKADYPESELDEITLYNDTAGKTFAFEIIGDVRTGMVNSPFPLFLQLFDLKDPGNGMEITRGKLEYELRGRGIYTVTVTDSN
jgi:hypothetical protein